MYIETCCSHSQCRGNRLKTAWCSGQPDRTAPACFPDCTWPFGSGTAPAKMETAAIQERHRAHSELWHNPSGPSPALGHGGDHHISLEKPQFAPDSGSNPSNTSLTPHQGGGSKHTLVEDVTHAHSRSSCPIKTPGHTQTAQGCSHPRTCLCSLRR